MKKILLIGAALSALSAHADIPQLKISEQRNEVVTMAAFKNTVNPTLDVLSLMFGIEELKIDVVNRVNAQTTETRKKNKIEGTMIALENATGYITALVGGSEYGQDNQVIRAVQARVQPGSSFKPLYYTAAIASKKFTARVIRDLIPIHQKATLCSNLFRIRIWRTVWIWPG